MKKNVCLKIDKLTMWKPNGKVQAERISLAVEKGEKVLIWGYAGEGIEEFMDIVAGIREPEEGSCTSYGKFSVIPAEFPYLESYNVREYLLLPLLVEGKTRREAWEKGKHILRNSILWEKRDRKIRFLSSFEQCILMLLMAQAQEPELLILGNCMKKLTREERQRFTQELLSVLEKQKAGLLCFSDNENLFLPFQSVYRMQDGVLQKQN